MTVIAKATPAGYTPPGLTLQPVINCGTIGADATKFASEKVTFDADTATMQIQALEARARPR